MTKIKKVLTYIFLYVMVIISLFPFYFMFVSATNNNRQILSIPPKLTPGTELLTNLANLNEKIDLLRVAFNSIFMAVVFTVLAILLYSMAGYALTKFQFRGKKLFFTIVMITLMMPPQVTYIPRFMLISRIGWVDTYQSVILPLLANGFGIFLMRQNMMAFPDALLEAGRLDGCSEFRLFFGIVMPNMKPSIAALGIYMFMRSWNEFMWPLIVLNKTGMQTLPVALSVLNGGHWRTDYGVIMLGAAIAVLPIMVIFLLFEKQFIAGIMGGSIKE